MSINAIAPGVTGQGISETQYTRFGAKGGTDFAFEDANSLNDRMAGRAVDPAGATNVVNGADRTYMSPVGSVQS